MTGNARLFRAVTASIILATSTPGLAYDIGAYAVSDHGNCGASNLPGTTAELKKFFSSSDFPKEARKNFFWTNSQVRQEEWKSTGDYRSSTTTANKFNGADASQITYIASHGSTSNGKYLALMGGTRYGGCYAQSKDLLLGDANARYLFLSTCQGLKIGPGQGDQPSQSGENPSRTWQDRSKGLHCILGYSNNMADRDSYGADFLKIWRAQSETLANAFFKASRMASYRNIPAMLCFGADQAEAIGKINDDKDWRLDAATGAESAWSYEKSREIIRKPGEKSAPSPAILAIQDREFPRAAMDKLTANAASIFRAEGGVVMYKRHASNKPAAQGPISDEHALLIAKTFIEQNDLAKANDTLQPTFIIDQAIGDKNGGKGLQHKTVVFHQNLFGITPLQPNGSIEIAIDMSGQVVAFTWALRDFSAQQNGKSILISRAQLSQARTLALRSWKRQFPKARITWEGQRIGYDAGGWHTAKPSAPLVIESTASITQGNFTRRSTLLHQP